MLVTVTSLTIDTFFLLGKRDQVLCCSFICILSICVLDCTELCNVVLKRAQQIKFYYFIIITVPDSLLRLSSESHRMMPKSSKYPPRPWVPNGSLKVRTTAATLVRFHMGPKMRFPNLQTNERRSMSLHSWGVHP